MNDPPLSVLDLYIFSANSKTMQGKRGLCQPDVFQMSCTTSSKRLCPYGNCSSAYLERTEFKKADLSLFLHRLEKSHGKALNSGEAHWSSSQSMVKWVESCKKCAENLSWPKFSGLMLCRSSTFNQGWD